MYLFIYSVLLVAVCTRYDYFTWQVICHCSYVRNLSRQTVSVLTSWRV